jgi:hypothetical protein
VQALTVADRVTNSTNLYKMFIVALNKRLGTDCTVRIG